MGYQRRNVDFVALLYWQFAFDPRFLSEFALDVFIIDDVGHWKVSKIQWLLSWLKSRRRSLIQLQDLYLSVHGTLI